MLSEAHIGLLVEGARSFDLSLTEAELSCFSVYVEELQRWSFRADLVSQTDTETIIRKHILDSLSVVPFLPEGKNLLDLGSGAGFPGLVIAIVRSLWTVFLVEARRKRANFLRQIIRKTALPNAKVHEGRAEKVATDTALGSSCDVVITRATWSLREFLRLASPFVAPNGSLIAMKGPQGKEELRRIEPSLQKLGFRLKTIEEYILPFGKETRQIIILAKECST